MANIIRILLYRKEEDLACYLTAFYNIHLDQKLIKQAVHGKFYKWLKFVWAFDKNMVESYGGEQKRVEYVTLFDNII